MKCDCPDSHINDAIGIEAFINPEAELASVSAVADHSIEIVETDVCEETIASLELSQEMTGDGFTDATALRVGIESLPEVSVVAELPVQPAKSKKAKRASWPASNLLPPTEEPIVYVRTDSCQDWFILTASLDEPSDSASALTAVQPACDAQAIAYRKSSAAPSKCNKSDGLLCVRRYTLEIQDVGDSGLAFNRQRDHLPLFFIRASTLSSKAAYSKWFYAAFRDTSDVVITQPLQMGWNCDSRYG